MGWRAWCLNGDDAEFGVPERDAESVGRWTN
jgi:hypothetical protein